jgi:hypothetical protein
VVTPFSEENISSIEVIRTFLPSVDSEELKWHWDQEDREIVFISRNDWKYQIDNDLPRSCQGTVLIKAGTWHRVIKGKSELRVKITKYQNSEDI